MRALALTAAAALLAPAILDALRLIVLLVSWRAHPELFDRARAQAQVLAAIEQATGRA